jgi:hypothetical protein
MGLSLIVAGSAVGGGATELYLWGTHQKTTLGTPIPLWCNAEGNAGAPTFTTPRRHGVAGGYQVTALKTLLLTRILFRASATAAFSFGYSDSDRGIDNAVDGANPVNLDSASASGSGSLIALVPNQQYDVPIYYEIPAGKFPRLILPTGLVSFRSQFFGHEV